MNILAIEAFRAVMITGSMTTASQMLLRTQPTVSRLISELEAELGISLFERKRRRLIPTPEARLLYEQAEITFENLARLKTFAAGLGQSASDMATIAAIPAFGSHAIPHIVRRVSESHSHARLNLIIDDAANVAERVAAGTADIGLSWMVRDPALVESELLLETELVCVLPVGHQLADMPQVTPADLHGEHLIGFNHENTPIVRLRDIFNRFGVVPIVRFETQRTHTVYGLVAQGLGISIVDPITSLCFPNDQVILRRFEPAVPISYFLIYPRGKSKSRLVRWVADEAKKVFADCDHAISQRLTK
jgi:DNA-binding transcriptional LysR family regulator